LLLDLSLPDSEGLATIYAAQQMVGDMPIVILTGRGDTDFSLKALEAGATDYMVKGDFGHDGLTRVIRYALSRTRMEAHNRLLVAALQAAANGIVITDRNASIQWVNPAFTQLTGYSLEEVLGKRPAELVKSGLQDQGFYEQMWCCLLAGESWRGEVINRRKDGSYYHEELSIAPVKNSMGEITHFIGIKEDITERKHMEAQLQRLASTDPLTGLLNRRVFLEHLSQDIARLDRFTCPPIALLMLDLDYFKHINDTYGHATGDAVLREFADIMRSSSRTIDITARLGGEEFAILLPGAGRNEALIVAERLREQTMATIIDHEKGAVRFTVSIGATALLAHDYDSESVLHRADIALYAAKDAGRNQTCWFDDNLDCLANASSD
jgi:diguanylate cyclase (GGDEF)-like protein/PAS domain S-box-containing protein